MRLSTARIGTLSGIEEIPPAHLLPRVCQGSASSGISSSVGFSIHQLKRHHHLQDHEEILHGIVMQVQVILGGCVNHERNYDRDEVLKIKLHGI